jgi:hypothetical protein
MKVGSVVTLKVACLGNPAGTVGVCYEIYSLGRGASLKDPNMDTSASFIFENGNYDGFSAEDIKHFLTHLYDSGLIYKFTNVMRLSEDFRDGMFRPYLTHSSHLLPAALVQVQKEENEDKIAQQVIKLLDAAIYDLESRPWGAKLHIQEAAELIRKHFIA